MFRMENSSLAHARLLNCYTIFLGQIIPGDNFLQKKLCSSCLGNNSLMWIGPRSEAPVHAARNTALQSQKAELICLHVKYLDTAFWLCKACLCKINSFNTIDRYTGQTIVHAQNWSTPTSSKLA